MSGEQIRKNPLSSVVSLFSGKTKNNPAENNKNLLNSHNSLKFEDIYKVLKDKEAKQYINTLSSYLNQFHNETGMGAKIPKYIETLKIIKKCGYNFNLSKETYLPDPYNLRALIKLTEDYVKGFETIPSFDKLQTEIEKHIISGKLAGDYLEQYKDKKNMESLKKMLVESFNSDELCINSDYSTKTAGSNTNIHTISINLYNDYFHRIILKLRNRPHINKTFPSLFDQDENISAWLQDRIKNYIDIMNFSRNESEMEELLNQSIQSHTKNKYYIRKIQRLSFGPLITKELADSNKHYSQFKTIVAKAPVLVATYYDRSDILDEKSNFITDEAVYFIGKKKSVSKIKNLGIPNTKVICI